MFRQGQYRDKDTAQPCTKVVIGVMSVDRDVATAVVGWRQGYRAAGGTRYQLRRESGVWRVEKILRNIPDPTFRRPPQRPSDSSDTTKQSNANYHRPQAMHVVAAPAEFTPPATGGAFVLVEIGGTD